MLSIKKDLKENERLEYFDNLRKKYESESEAIFATAWLWDDGIVFPENTLDVLGISLLTAMNNFQPFQTSKVGNFGIFRM